MSTRVSFSVTTHRNVVGAVGGHTTKRSTRLTLGGALNWVLGEVPVEACTAEYDKDAERTVITIDWAKIPAEIRDGTK